MLCNQFIRILMKSYVKTMRAEMPAFFVFLLFMERSWKTKACIFSFFLMFVTVNYVFRVKQLFKYCFKGYLRKKETGFHTSF